jgi:hypothetical protein
MTNNMSQRDLIAALSEAGIKHTPENIIWISETTDSRIIWLESGGASGLAHIIDRHKEDFVDRGVQEDMV